jgi:hypothetical protein
VGFAQLASGATVAKEEEGFSAIASTFVHPNGYAFFLLVVLGVGWVAFSRARNLAIRLALGTGLLLGLVSLVLTYGRSAWGASIAILLALAVLEYRRLLLIAPIAFVAFVTALPGAAGSIGARFDDLTDPAATRTTRSRGGSTTGAGCFPTRTTARSPGMASAATSRSRTSSSEASTTRSARPAGARVRSASNPTTTS